MDEFNESLKQNNIYDKNNLTQSSKNLIVSHYFNDFENDDEEDLLQQNQNNIYRDPKTKSQIGIISSQNCQSFQVTINKNKNKKNIENIKHNYTINKKQLDLQKYQVINEIQNIDYVEDIDDVQDIDDIQDNDDIEDIDQIQKTDKTEYFQKSLFKNNYTKVFYQYKTDSNQLTIRKELKLTIDTLFNNSSLNNQFKKECKILEQLKDQNITLNMLQQDEDNFSFEQILGKCDLKTLHKKTKNRHIFESCFLILLDKLNKMHKLGIAHSDIKPQNIVISYSDEPFFIDFDASVFLSDFKSYLKSYTYRFNLNVYGEENSKKNKFIKTKIFQSEEEIKLCDRTQLALTFLYLLSENKNQLNLFQKKNFNELIQQLIIKEVADEKNLFNKEYSKPMNRLLILSIISKILNQADPTIKIIGEQNQDIFVIDHSVIYEELKNSNDIIFDQESNTYVVNRIDQFSIKLLYLLDQIQCNIEINPQEMLIIPQPQMYEYNYIFSNYKQLQEYFLNFLNGYGAYNEYDRNNLSKYVKKLKNQKCFFELDDQSKNQQLFKSLRKSQYLSTLELNFKFHEEYFQTFIDMIKQELPQLYIIKYQQNIDNYINCQISGDTNFNTQIIDIEFNFPFLCSPKDELQKLIDQKKSNQKINILKINYILDYDDTISRDYLLRILNNLIEIIEQIEYNQLQLQIKQEIIFEENCQSLLQIQNTEINKNQFQIYPTKYQCINEVVQQFKQSSDFKSFQEDEIIFKIKQFEYQRGENLAVQILLSSQNLNNKSYGIFLKFQNYFFTDKIIWLQINQNLESYENQFIEIEVVNCQFTQEIVDILQEIKLRFQQIVKYEFIDDLVLDKDEFSQQDKGKNRQKSDKKLENKLSYKFDFHCSQNISNKFRLSVYFIKKFDDNNQFSLDNQLQNNSIKGQPLNQQNWENQSKPKKQDNQENNLNKNKNNKAIQNFLQNSQLYKVFNLQELKVFYDENSQYLLKVQSINKIATGIKNKKDIMYIIEEINNKIHYSEFQVDKNKIKFSYYDNWQSSIKYDLDSNQQSQYIQFYNLMYQIIQNNQTNTNIDINLIKNYKSVNLDFHFIKNVKFIEENNNQSDNKLIKNIEIFKLQDIKLTYNLTFKEELLDLISDKINEELLNRLLLEQNNNFQMDTLINTKIQQLLYNKIYSVKFVFQNQKISDGSFKIIYEFTLKYYKIKQIEFKFTECSLTKQTLFHLYRVINETKDQQTIYHKFKFFKNEISSLNLEEFINLLIQEQSHHQFIFQFKSCNSKVIQIFQDQYQNILKFTDFIYPTFYYNPQIQQNESSQIILIKFVFEQKYCLEFLSNKFNLTSQADKKDLTLQQFLQNKNQNDIFNNLDRYTDFKENFDFNYSYLDDSEEQEQSDVVDLKSQSSYKNIQNESESQKDEGKEIENIIQLNQLKTVEKIEFDNQSSEQNIQKQIVTEDDIKHELYNNDHFLQKEKIEAATKFYEKLKNQINHTNIHPNLLNYVDLQKIFEYKD